MLKYIKAFLVNILTVAAVGTGLLMLLVGYSDRVNPVEHVSLGCLGMLFPATILLHLLMMVVVLAVAWKRVWIPLLFFVFAYVPIRTYIPINFPSTPSDDCLCVVSYNVCQYGGNYKYDEAIDTVMGYARRVGADIVCIQEDATGKKFKPMERWPELFPYNDTVHVNTGKLINAVGIHTRFPIVGKEVIDYNSIANGSVAYYLLIERDTVIVINNHLESTHLSSVDRERYKEVIRGNMEREEAKDEASNIIRKLNEGITERAPQADSVHHYIETHRRYPIIVCGDFNDTPISYVRHTIAQGLTDCFVEAGRGLGLSYNQKGFNLRIDHIMCSSHFIPLHCHIDSKMDASDHYPLVCRLKKVDNP